jgi:hypothetical protein
MSVAGAWLRRVAIFLMLCVLAAAMLTARVVHDGRLEMVASDAAFDRGDVRSATVHARRAAVLYAPGAPHVTPAYQRLIAIAVGAEAAGDMDAARTAWRAVRGAALETRHLWIPRRTELQRANQSLARLQSLAAAAPRGDVAKTLQRALGQLERDDAAPAIWVAALMFGFATAALGLGLVGWRGVTPEGRITLAGARIGLLLAVIGAACWTLAAWKA